MAVATTVGGMGVADGGTRVAVGGTGVAVGVTSVGGAAQPLNTRIDKMMNASRRMVFLRTNVGINIQDVKDNTG